MRCIFTMFAEDVGLLPEGLFTKALKEQWLPHPEGFPRQIEHLWRTMNDGGEIFNVVGRILRFNGGLFADPQALKLDKKALGLLLEAAECNWSDVEPAIFGTLLERALDPKERHALGAHYTPRAYVERLVRPTIEEPLRADWDVVRAQVRRIILASERSGSEQTKTKKRQEAIAVVKEFHARLCNVRVLDPACGSGNFLYVTLDLFKRLEGEILSLLDSLRASATFHQVRVTPEQFHGIEVKPWAKEIAELVLWIGYLQWHFRMYGKSIPVPEPVLRDYKNIECRDAVLAYDGEPELMRDEKGKPVTRWDGETMKSNPVTGEQVPDETARVNVYTYKNPRKAEWPEADFIVGNPPFVGNKRMRLVLEDGYVEALRMAFPEVPESADLVMYWWHKAATLVEAGRVRQFGLITTNSITQGFNKRVVEAYVGSRAALAFAVPDHPWVDTKDGAQVRIAMTCLAATGSCGRLEQILDEREGVEGERTLRFSSRFGTINPDLTIGVNFSMLAKLNANRGLSCPGVQLSGQGFVLSPADAATFSSPTRKELLRQYLTGRDLAQARREQYVIDTFGLSELDLRQRFPDAYQWLADRVRPERQQNPRASYASRWWLHSEPRAKFRSSLSGLIRFAATSRTARHRVFQYLPGLCLPETKVLVFALDQPELFAVLSSRIHVVFANATGGWLGVGNDSTYNHSQCFETFPFPALESSERKRMAPLAEELDAHRKRQQAVHPDLTITGMYNVLEKLRSGEALTAKDKVIHEQGLVSVLKKLHDDLDAAVFDAYGWPHDLTDEQILERLVALNAERAAEERRGLIRWLRPEFQNPSGAKAATQEDLATTDEPETATPVAATAAAWPKKLAEQIAAVRDLLTKGAAEWTKAEVAAAFKGANKAEVEEVLDSLAALGILAAYESRGTRRWKSTRTAA
jgi:hypothetical protein